MAALPAFQDAEHEAFFWPGGRAAALLVHGFPGTPSEMRSLGRVLHDAGWSVHGMLLPGFGAQIGTLFRYRYADWLAAVQQSLESLAREYHPVLLVGFSLGGGLSLQASARFRPDALALLAPFWRLDGRLWQWALWRSVRRFTSHVRPFSIADFDNRRWRALLATTFPGLDLDLPSNRAALRALNVPAEFVDSLLAGALAGYDAAPHVRPPGVRMPLLVVQGTRDDVVPARTTRALVARLPGMLRYVEVPAGHALPDARGPAWQSVAGALLALAAEVQAEARARKGSAP